jgi:hypothetical protein
MVQVKPVEGDALVPDRDFHQVGSGFEVEAVAVHAEVEGSIPQADEPGKQLMCVFAGRAHTLYRN